MESSVNGKARARLHRKTTGWNILPAQCCLEIIGFGAKAAGFGTGELKGINEGILKDGLFTRTHDQ
jgi:hypothetical protein